MIKKRVYPWTDESIISNEDLTFTDLNSTINGNTNSTVYLSNNYKYDDDSDSNFQNSIIINRNLKIYGNGVTLDGSKSARIFNVTSDINVNFYNITFINGKSTFGGAIYFGNATNCTFTKNEVEYEGGAIFNGSAFDCIFTDNKSIRFFGGAICYGNVYNCVFLENSVSGWGGAVFYCNVYDSSFRKNKAGLDARAMYMGNAYDCDFYENEAADNGGAIYYGNAYNCEFNENKAHEHGSAIHVGNATNCTFWDNFDKGQIGVMYKGHAILCTFIDDSTDETTIIHTTINVLNYTSTYMSGEMLNFNLTADGMLFNGLDTFIKIFKDDELIYFCHALTGEGWIVDLNPGVFTAVLSLKDYPDEPSSSVTITVLKSNATVVLSPIMDVKVGNEIAINYTTNSNGTVTIKVNDQLVSGGKFTPSKSGIYNVSVEIAENDYYIVASNKTTFTVVKLESEIFASPVTTTYNVDKNLLIILKDENGKPIKGAVLTVNLGGAKKYKTDNKGQIKINVAKLIPRTYNVKISYDGSDIYNSSTTSVNVKVKKATSKITPKSVSPKRNVKTKRHTEIFKDNKNNSLENTKSTLKVNDKNYSVKIIVKVKNIK